MVAVISFVMALVGITLQMIDAFPKHREARQTVASVGVGVFIGAAVTSLLGASYDISADLNRQFVLLLGLAGATAGFGITAVIVADAKRREVASVMVGVFAVGFLVSGFFVAVGSSVGQRSELSTDELIHLATRAEGSGANDHAVELLESARARVSSQKAQEQLSQRINAIRDAQAKAVAVPQ